ncbi:MAG: tetratricopeptide repeat protein, partial [Desulfobulbia bacterium]
LRERLKGEDVYKLHGLASLPGAFSRSLIVAGMAELGNFGNIEVIGNEAIDIAEKVQNALTLTFVYNFVAMAYLRLGKLKSAIPLLEKSHELCCSSELQSMYAFTIGNLGCAYLLAKEFDRALALLEEGAKEENIQASFWPTHPLTVLADAYRLVGELSSALETISSALQMTDQRDERGFEAWAMLIMAMVKSAQEKHDESKEWYLRTLQQATNLSMQPLVAHCHAGLADVNMHIGDKNASELEKSKSIKLYQDLGMDFWLSY